MSPTLPQINENYFQDTVLTGKGAFLLDLWADWCAPCHALTPVLERLAQAYGTAITVAQLDVDANQAMKDRLAVRSIPTLLLFRDGAEIARITGVHPYDKLAAWLGANGVAPPDGHAKPVQHEAEWSAFHGDVELKRFFFDRVLSHAEAGEITVGRMSHWGPKGGTICSAFMRQAQPSFFARATGLPNSFGLAMEFAGITTAEQISQVFDAIPPGANLADVAPRLMLAWLGNPDILTPAYLDDPRLDAIRMDWARHLRAILAEETVAPATWIDLRQRARNLRKELALGHPVVEPVATMLSRLSPPPQPDDASDWAGILLRVGLYTVITRPLFEAGYTHYHLDLENVQHRFYENMANGRPLNTEIIAEVHQKWREKHADLQKILQDMNDFYSANRHGQYNRVIPLLVSAIEETVFP